MFTFYDGDIVKSIEYKWKQADGGKFTEEEIEILLTVFQKKL